mgnify:CR=1 FL=1
MKIYENTSDLIQWTEWHSNIDLVKCMHIVMEENHIIWEFNFASEN